MFSVQKVENNIRSLYRYGMDAAGYSKASVESMLDTLNFYELAQAAQHNSATPHASVLNSAMFSHFPLTKTLFHAWLNCSSDAASSLTVEPNTATQGTPARCMRY